MANSVGPIADVEAKLAPHRLAEPWLGTDPEQSAHILSHDRLVGRADDVEHKPTTSNFRLRHAQ
ncbi:hypothetical protein [Streptomyces vastus]